MKNKILLALAVIATPVLLLLGPWLFLTASYPDKSCLPRVYQVDRPLHDDWPPLLKWVPRKSTYFCIPMPPKLYAGNLDSTYNLKQDCYEYEKDTVWEANNGKIKYLPFPIETGFIAPPPVGPAGTWGVLSAPINGRYVPVFFTKSWEMFGKQFHFNFGLKPDTVITFSKWAEEDGPTHDKEGNRTRPDNGCTVGDSHWAYPEMSFTYKEIK